MKKPERNRYFLARTLLSLSGILIWAAHFGLVYGLQHLVCHAGILPEGWVPLLTVFATVMAVIAMGGCFRMAQRDFPFSEADQDVRAFYRHTTVVLQFLSLFGILATCLAGLMLPACPELR